MEDSIKFENLRCLYEELHSSRKKAEEFHNKVAFSFSTILLVLAVLVAQGDHAMAVTIPLKVAISIIIALAVAVGLTYIRAISHTNRERYLMIVRVEQALGFHTSDQYITNEEIAKFDNRPYLESSLLPVRSMNWGEKDYAKYSYSHFVKANMLAVALSGFVAIVVVSLA